MNSRLSLRGVFAAVVALACAACDDGAALPSRCVGPLCQALDAGGLYGDSGADAAAPPRVFDAYVPDPSRDFGPPRQDACVEADEQCNDLDDDCDGRVDEALPTTGEVCGSGTGACRPGVRACLRGAWVCEGEGAPGAERCNGLDDDCDGLVDDAPEDVGQPCGQGAQCAAGRTVCDAGQLSCVGAVGAADETCNGADDDCDGRIDEAFPELGSTCGITLGACRAGQVRCIAGSLTCFGQLGPTPEACDTEDNDCDGQVDEADDAHGGGACPAQGDRCVESAQCGAGGRCVDDYGQRYCSVACADDAGCENGTFCGPLGGSNYCRRAYAGCAADAACSPDERCMLVPAVDPSVFGGECRPALPGGLPTGAACGADTPPCAGRLCLGDIGQCASLCGDTPECGAGFSCVRTPFVLGDRMQIEVGLCIAACTGDTDCSFAQSGLVCQYGLGQGAGEGFVGYCDVPRPGGRTGDVCDLSASPPLGCDHGYCRRDGRGRYCTQGCASANDCPAGWACTPNDFQTSGGVFTLGLCQRP